MPAPGGSQRVVGNNPIAIAVPCLPDPVVMDFATSASAMGKSGWRKRVASFAQWLSYGLQGRADDRSDSRN
jgi:LDH2 family malate/lactate/ureidoglycolate dehydrogenase